MGHLTRVEHVRAGPVFDVSRALLDGRPVYLKTVGDRDDVVRRSGLASGRLDHVCATRVFYRRGMGWSAIEDTVPERAHYESLLRAEFDVIGVVREHWNHPGARLAHWHGDKLVAEGGEICLVMPACEGTALGRLPYHEQREWFPAMLPALWQALSRCPHGDLNPDDLVIDPSGRFFRILDPGVTVDGPSHETPPEGSFRSTLFTTNIAHYPLLLPKYGPDPPELCARNSKSLSDLLRLQEGGISEKSNSSERTRLLGGSASPAAADLIALGAMYAFILTGIPLHELLGLNRPYWSGTWVDGRGRHFESADRLVDEIEGVGLLRALQTHGATGKEADLCVRLVGLHIHSKDELTMR